MPLTTQNITVSGVGLTAAVPNVIVTYDCNQMGETLPWPNNGNQNRVPGFLYVGGNVTYQKDSQGNLVTGNQKQAGSG